MSKLTNTIRTEVDEDYFMYTSVPTSRKIKSILKRIACI